MSRLALKAVPLPDKVQVSVEKDRFQVEGPLGKVEHAYLPDFVQFRVEGSAYFVDRRNSSKDARAYQGLYWALLRNAVQGVSVGFSKTLLIQGVGYRWEIKGSQLVCNVGYSHQVFFDIPEDVTLTLPAANQLQVSGFNKERVGQVAANIRFIKKPEPYKGKGIRYADEVLRLKAGKTGKKKK